MVQAIIRMSVPPAKLKEVLQTLQAILDPIRRSPGCLSCECYRHIEDETTICLIEEWLEPADLDAHLRSVLFSVLAGAMDLFVREPDIRFNTVSRTAGSEAIVAARGAEKHY